MDSVNIQQVHTCYHKRNCLDPESQGSDENVLMLKLMVPSLLGGLDGAGGTEQQQQLQLLPQIEELAMCMLVTPAMGQIVQCLAHELVSRMKFQADPF